MPRRTKPVSLNTRLWFGKYQGLTVQAVVECDPHYLMWAHEEIDWFELPGDLYEALLDDLAEARDDDLSFWELHDWLHDA